MRAVLVESPGGLDRLRLAEVPDPVPAAGEVLIEVAFAGCNWSDVQKRRGVYPDPVGYPAIIGLEVSGRVRAAGAGVRGFAAGDRVAALTGPRMLGGYAEQVAVPAAYVMPLPAALPLDVGAAFPAVALTAYHLLRTAHRVREGEVVLVHSIGGAVGLSLTQIAAALGATVIGTVGGAAASDRVRSPGFLRSNDRIWVSGTARAPAHRHSRARG